MLKVGLIGCGFMGGMHSACYKVIDGVEVVAVADVRREKAEEVAKVHGAEIYASGEELINNAQADIIDICLPTYLHTEHAIKAMNKVKNIFIEKPVCLTKEEGKLLLDEQKKTGANIQVGQVIRLWDEYKWLKDAADEGKFGRLHSAVFQHLSSYPIWAWDNWLHQGEKSGSVALDMHIHDVDFMRYLMGEPKSVTSSATRDNTGMIEQIFTTFKFDDAVATVEICWHYPDDFPFTAGYRIMFDKATVVNGADGLMVYYKDGGKEKIEIKPSFEGANDIGGNISSLGGYYNELKYFVERLSEGKPLEIAPLDEGVKSVELALDEIASVGGAQVK